MYDSDGSLRRHDALLIYPKINHRQLFDLQKDPGEMTSLADMPGHQETLERLTALMKT
jgi:hypothetical protein